jgi:hypothetical protein
MEKKFLHAHELPDDNGYMLALKFFGSPNQDGEDAWTAENNPIGHTIITVGDQQFIYDALNKGLRAIIKNSDGGWHLTEPFNTSYYDVSTRPRV